MKRHILTIFSIAFLLISLQSKAQEISSFDNSNINISKFEQNSDNAFDKLANKEKVKIYPNPSKGSITIENADNFDILIFNILGKKVLEIKNCEFEKIDLNKLPNGNYVVQIISNNQISTHKLSLIK
ncbi:MAG: T9SS type A sorting domain-containing protein [Bacteroidales bacterium]|nr:T9SS type A sorting domain-containing protein [Bacteroidales bacterium]